MCFIIYMSSFSGTPSRKDLRSDLVNRRSLCRDFPAPRTSGG